MLIVPGLSKLETVTVVLRSQASCSRLYVPAAQHTQARVTAPLLWELGLGLSKTLAGPRLVALTLGSQQPLTSAVCSPQFLLWPPSGTLQFLSHCAGHVWG